MSICFVLAGCSSQNSTSSSASSSDTSVSSTAVSSATSSSISASGASSSDAVPSEPDLSISEPVEITRHDSFEPGFFYAKWMIQNNTDGPITDISVQFADYDDAGNIVNSPMYSTAYDIDVEPGQSIALETNHDINATTTSALSYMYKNASGKTVKGKFANPAKIPLQA